MTKRIYNFSAGPAVLPLEVLEESSKALIAYKETGIGILEMSHRSKPYMSIVSEAKQNIKDLMNIGDDYDVLFLQGGASLQFYMVPLNFHQNKPTSYIDSGVWASKAISEAKRLGKVNVVASSKDKNYCYIPAVKDEMIPADSAYVHYTSNNTIFGTEYRSEPASNNLPLICDASSDFMSRKVDVSRHGLIYAGAQKNVGPAGCVIVIIKKSWLEISAKANLTPMLSYAVHAENDSLYNTPPAFSIYVIGLVLQWIKKLGGLDAMEKINKEKAAILYDYLDESKFYKATAEKNSRSLMNICFLLPTQELEDKFNKEAEKNGFSGLKGHRSVGGMRASIYNAFPKEGVVALVDFMKKFEVNNK